MAFCPKCRAEYREQYARCSDCGVALVPTLPPEPDTREDYAYLCSIQDGPVGEAELGVLRTCDIPYFKRYPDSGAISALYTGRSLTGIEVFVPVRCLDEARRVLSPASNDTERQWREAELVPEDEI